MLELASTVTHANSTLMERARRTHFVRILLLLRTRFLPIARVITHKLGLESCMRKAVFAGAVALAMMGPLLVSEKGIGPCVGFAAQEVVVTEGKIARLRRAASERRATAALASGRGGVARRDPRAARGRAGCSKVRDRVGDYAGSAMALQRALSAAGPLIASLDENSARRPQCVAFDGRRLDVLEHDPRSGHRFSVKIMLHEDALISVFVLTAFRRPTGGRFICGRVSARRSCH